MSVQEPVRTRRSARRSAARLERRPLRSDVELLSREAEREVRRDLRAERMLLLKAAVSLALAGALLALRFFFLA